MVGPTALLGASGYPGNLEIMRLPRRGYWRGDAADEFASQGTYVYNNLHSNKGGIVPVGGMTIDGYSVPAGVLVIQFRDFSAGDILMSDGTSFVFRGCRFRGPRKAPGYFNCGIGAASASFYFFFNDMGGLGSGIEDFNEIPCKISNAAAAIAFRNRISFTGAGFQFNIVSGSEITENFISNLTTFGTGSHLNGITFNGGETCALILRNSIVVVSPDTSGRDVNQTDCISFFQDFGAFPGYGINRDQSVGYKIDNNYVGGTGYCVYAGQNRGSQAKSVGNMVITNTLVTTSVYPRGGFNGPIAAEPDYQINGNLAVNNRWADGPRVGQLAWGS